MYPAGVVNTQDIVIGGGLWLDEIGRLGEALGDQAIVNETVLTGGEDVIAEIEIVTRVVNELEPEHASRLGGTTVLLHRYIMLLDCL
jgi:hypothetical protein